MFRLHKSIKPLYSLNKSFCLNNQRLKSAWIKASSASSKEDIDVESLFIDDKVQQLLTNLTGLDVEGKIFTQRNIESQERSHYALMTDSMLEETRAHMKDRAAEFLQFVPVKEPREESFTVLSKDVEIDGFDTSKFVFTDITFDATNQDRTVVIREPDGTLRTALPEEHDRMNRVYYEQPNRSINPPEVFKDPHLKEALDKNRHEFVLDFACWFYEPDDPAFVQLSHLIFDRIVEENKFEILYSTRHFGSLVFYLVLNNNLPPLLNFYGSKGSVHGAADVIRLQKIVFPNWRTAISFNDSDEKIIRNFINQNRRFKDEIPDLMNLLDMPLERQYQNDSREGKSSTSKSSLDSQNMKRLTNVNRNNLRTEEGPLGKLSEEYDVKYVNDENEIKAADEIPKEQKEQLQQRNQYQARGRRLPKISTFKERLAEIETEKNKKD